MKIKRLLYFLLKWLFNGMIWIFSFFSVITFSILMETLGIWNSFLFSSTLFVIFLTISNIVKNKILNDEELYNQRKELFYLVDDINDKEYKKKIKDNIEFLDNCKYEQIYNQLKSKKINLDELSQDKECFIRWAKENKDSVDKICRDYRLFLSLDNSFNSSLYEDYLFSITSLDNVLKRNIDVVSITSSIVATIISLKEFFELNESSMELLGGIIIFYIIISAVLLFFVFVYNKRRLKKEQNDVLEIINFLNNQEVK